MSTLEMAINLLQEMPEQAVETVYAFMQSMLVQQNRRTKPSVAFGIAHKYANPALIEKEKGAFERAMVKKHEID
jgi:O-succinylbenzoate synthase